MSTKSSRSKSRSKQEIQDSYDDVVDASSEKDALSPKEKEAKKARERDVLQRIAALSPEKALQQVAQTHLDINRTLGDVTSLYTERFQELQTLTDAIKIKKEELTEMHGVEIAASALDVLIADYQEKKKQFEQEIDAERTRWAEEQQAHTKEVMLRNADLQLSRQRDEAQYQYQTQQSRKKSEDDFREQMRIIAAQERDRHEQLEKNWAEREKNLQAREQELTNLKAQVDGFPAQLSAEVAKAERILSNTLKKDHEHAITLLQRDAAAAAQLADARIKTLEETKEKLLVQVAELQQQVATASTKVTEVANKALEAAGGQAALLELRNSLSVASQNGPVKRA